MEILLVGKGPSAAEAWRHCDGRLPIAAVNDAVKLVPGFVDCCFATDIEMLEACRSEWPRIGRFVLPSILHRNWTERTTDLPSGLPSEKLVRFPYTTVRRSEFNECLRKGLVCRRTTTTSAMSWLFHAGYRKFNLIGFDGGTGVAPGMHEIRTGFDYSDYARDQAALIEELQTFGVEIEWLT